MKKITLVMLILSLAVALPANAQFGKLIGKGKSAGKKSGSFGTVWESEFDNKASRLAVSVNNGKYILATDDNSATVLDVNGKTIWSGDYKKITTNKTNKCEYQYVIQKAEGKGGYLFLFDERKLGTDRVAVLDIVTGKELWNSEEYQNLIQKGTKAEEGGDEGELDTVKYIYELDAFLISQKASVILVKADTGEKIWETNRFKGGVGKYIYDAGRNEIIMINFKPTALGALFAGFKNQLVKINAVNGEILWDATFLGTIEKELVTRRAIVDLWIKGDKLYMYLDGLQVYNINNGQKLWEVTYENDMKGANGGLFSGGKRSKIYRTIADPLFTDDAVYIVILGTRDRTKYVEKHDLASGKLLWASEKITGAFCMPNIYKSGDKVLVQVGGKVQVQEFRLEETSSGLSAGMALGGFGGGSAKQWVPYIYWDYKAQKNSVLCLDDKTGITAWRSEKFDKRITDFILENNKTLFVGDGDEFYGYDIASGNQLFDVKHNDAKVGKATDVIDFGENVVVLSEKGLASYSKKDGKRVYATEKIRGVDYFYEIEGNYYLRDQRNSKNIIYGIDMTNGETKGSVQSKGKGGSPQYGAGIDITDDGEFIFAFKGKKVEKIKVNN
ncbi:PQQ-binding-like beta-propeller repeat protein [Flavobacterium sp. J49]|uniref:outer membrane protein assembly factor BamB family protein n=1 Tax=Flavobacterium sp. J49 TaxID=2718534 RepID=UPI001593F485|nr:PQQ-binding-like beta-propeller repeat protein [Flavobacterium sp. J49]MBF6640503.1 PQQ-binding-like beta-propeller repeat protein [Flavobacterium sp. J49]NIC01750.1 PQQ-binding-like beta-propeller repeat protein [Flavobacterium sp. J49]